LLSDFIVNWQDICSQYTSPLGHNYADEAVEDGSYVFMEAETAATFCGYDYAGFESLAKCYELAEELESWRNACSYGPDCCGF